jgi:hypothetical protein
MPTEYNRSSWLRFELPLPGDQSSTVDHAQLFPIATPY